MLSHSHVGLSAVQCCLFESRQVLSVEMSGGRPAMGNFIQAYPGTAMGILPDGLFRLLAPQPIRHLGFMAGSARLTYTAKCLGKLRALTLDKRYNSSPIYHFMKDMLQISC